MAKTKALISCAFTAQLICVFVFAYANCWFSHAHAHLYLSNSCSLWLESPCVTCTDVHGVLNDYRLTESVAKLQTKQPLKRNAFWLTLYNIIVSIPASTLCMYGMLGLDWVAMWPPCGRRLLI